MQITQLQLTPQWPRAQPISYQYILGVSFLKTIQELALLVFEGVGKHVLSGYGAALIKGGLRISLWSIGFYIISGLTELYLDQLEILSNFPSPENLIIFKKKLYPPLLSWVGLTVITGMFISPIPPSYIYQINSLIVIGAFVYPFFQFITQKTLELAIKFDYSLSQYWIDYLANRKIEFIESLPGHRSSSQTPKASIYDYRVALAVLKQKGEYWRYISPELRDQYADELIQTAVKGGLKEAPLTNEQSRNDAFMMSLIEHEASIFNQCSLRLLALPSFVVEALSKNSNACLSHQWFKQKNFWLTTASQMQSNDLTEEEALKLFSHFPSSLKGKREVIDELVSICPTLSQDRYKRYYR